MDDEFHWLALGLIPGVGARTFHRLLQHFGNPQRVFLASAAELERIPGLQKRSIEAIQGFHLEETVGRELKRLQQMHIRMIRWGTAAYPAHLANIADPPALLYVKGEFSPEDERAVAVVGARQASGYGLAICKRLCMDLAERGWCVVSGMARGIDSMAHRGALKGGGRTLAVLGTGLDVIYPAENRELYEEIAASGAVISEFPLGIPPDPGNFPLRNRLISGLALGVVVVEATGKSGSLITARLALEQDRQVFAVPGQVRTPGVAGPHRLIKEGAKLVETVEDIIEELEPMVSRPLRPPARAEKTRRPSLRPPLNSDEREIWEVLSMEPLHIDLIARRLGQGVSRVAGILVQLEVRGLVKQLPGALFLRNPELAMMED